MSKEDFDSYSDEEDIEFVSRSQIKRETHELQEMGEFLVDMSKNQLANIPLTPELSEAIVLARRLKSREARRRQIQYIGKLMRNTDMAPINQAIEKIRTQGQRHQVLRQQSIEWAERICQEGPSVIEDFLAQFYHGDRQQLRQLQRASAKEASANAKLEDGKKPTKVQIGKLQQCLLEAMELQ
ncbi:ribosome biogenesis factor YjgA [Pseudoteredinibacter isoporae]|uniref:ribosome biogenesis factor YjgA n=1 Tax=Pseudoteredinibacter isoporae TaxID=570281 RepID=UPI003102EBEF